MNAMKKGFRTPAAFVSAAENPPEQTIVDPSKGIMTVLPNVTEQPQGGESAQAGAANPEQPEKGQGGSTEPVGGHEVPAVDAEQAHPIVDAVEKPASKTATAKGKGKAKPEKVEKPWDKADPRIKPLVPVRMPESLHLKLLYLKTIVPNVSLNSMAVEAIEEKADKLLRQWDKEPDHEAGK